LDKRLEEKIRTVITEPFSDQVLEEQGCTSEVRKLVTENQIYILKSSFENRYRKWLNTESEVLKNNQHLPVPKYFGYFEEEESSHLLMSFEEGITLKKALSKAETSEEEKHLIRSFGRFLQQFHEGSKTATADQHWLERQLIKAEHYLATGEADGTHELLEHLKQYRPKPVKQSLIHGDCTTDNVMVKDGEVYLLIDVAGLTIGDPRYDEALAIGRFKDHVQYLEAFYEGYTRYKISEEEYRYFDRGLYEFF
jgi:aminoglycoside phosphotransferase (APT) family kinase protein